MKSDRWLVSVGRLRYSVGSGGYKLVLQIDPEIARYYRWFIPPEYRVRQPKWDPHITLVRNETVPVLDAWWKHDGDWVSFTYAPVILNHDPYWYLYCASAEFYKIRAELGLRATSPYTRAPDGSPWFHTTIGNTKWSVPS